MALSGWAQNAGPAPLGLTMGVLFEGNILPEGANVAQPVQFFIHPELQPTVAMHEGDAVTLDFFADGNKLTSAKAIWHDAQTPRTAPGQARPAYVVPAQFRIPNYIWTNVPTGSHHISIRAYGFRDFPAVSVSVHITVIPPLPPVPVCGTHTLTGAARPPLKPEQVTLLHAKPSGAYEVVGKVAGIAPGLGRQDEQDALNELKKQAALIGANGVIIGQESQSKGKPFSINTPMIIPPQTRVMGEAIYLHAAGNQ